MIFSINISKYKLIVLILLLVFTLIIFIASSNWFLTKVYPFEYRDLIYSNSKQNGIDPYLVAAIIKVESKYKSEAVSPKGAIGLMQIMPETAYWIADNLELKNFNSNDLFEPSTNIKIGTWYVNNLMNEFNDNLILVLASYNAGRGNVNKWLNNKKLSKDGKNLNHIPFEETRNYVERTIMIYEAYLRIYS